MQICKDCHRPFSDTLTKCPSCSSSHYQVKKEAPGRVQRLPKELAKQLQCTS